MVPRRGSIYDRLDEARAQRLRTLSPQTAANSDPSPVAKPRARSKSHLLPTIKSQQDFEPPVKTGIPAVAKLGLGLVAFSIMAGFTLLDWGSGQGLQTSVTPPAEIKTDAVQTQLPSADDPARVADAPRVNAAPSEGLPAIPSAPSDAVVVQVQQETAPLKAPESPTSNDGLDP